MGGGVRGQDRVGEGPSGETRTKRGGGGGFLGYFLANYGPEILCLEAEDQVSSVEVE